MSIVIHNGEKQEHHTSEAHEGEGWDTCPTCDTDVEPVHEKVNEHGDPQWFMYSHDQREGGCGANWTRTTKEGLKHNEQVNQQTKWLSASADVGRVHSLPTAAYQRGYDAIDWSK